MEKSNPRLLNAQKMQKNSPSHLAFARALMKTKDLKTHEASKRYDAPLLMSFVGDHQCLSRQLTDDT